MNIDHPDMIACARLVEKGDPDRFRAVMAAPVSARVVLFPIFAANVEISRAPWVTQEEMIAEMRLQWWRDAIDEIASDKTPRRHEVVTPLARMINPEDKPLLAELVEARRWDIYRDPFADEAAFEDYLMKTSANLLQVAVSALGGGDEDVVRDLGYATGLANFLRAVRALERSGRVPLVDGREKAVTALARDGLERLKRARSQRCKVSKQAAPALFTAWQAETILKQAAQTPGLVKSGILGNSEFRGILTLYWRTQTGRW